MAQNRATPSPQIDVDAEPSVLPLVHIRSGSELPIGAYTAANYRDRRFWVDDGDLRSKRVFMFLMIFSALSESRVVPQVPAESTGASMPLLRWPHDHHRDLRARLPAQAPAHADAGANQDRHLMMPLPPSNARCHTRDSRWLAAGRDQARVPPIDPQPVSSSNLPRIARAARSPLQPRRRLQPKRPQQPMRSNILLPDPPTKSP